MKRKLRAYRKAKKLFSDFTGMDAGFAHKVHVPENDVLVVVGDCDGLLYTTVRDGKRERYIHEFKASSRPLLAVSPDGRNLYLVGG